MLQTKTSKARSGTMKSSTKTARKPRSSAAKSKPKVKPLTTKSSAKTVRKPKPSTTKLLPKKSPAVKYSSTKSSAKRSRVGNAAMLKKAHEIAKREQKRRPRTPYNKLVGEAMKSLAK